MHPLQKYQYYTLLNNKLEDQTAQMNALGADGWKMVTACIVVVQGTVYERTYFIRPEPTQTIGATAEGFKNWHDEWHKATEAMPEASHDSVQGEPTPEAPQEPQAEQPQPEPEQT